MICITAFGSRHRYDVIVNLHWGDEYVHAPSHAQITLADRLTLALRARAQRVAVPST